MSDAKCRRCGLSQTASCHDRFTAEGAEKDPLAWHEFTWPLLPCQQPSCLACQDGRVEKCLKRVPRRRYP